jgi:hypothetical protein
MKSAKLFLLGLLAMFSQFALAVPPDFSSLTTALDVSTIGAVILAVAVMLAGVYVYMKGAGTALSFFKRH